MGGQHRKRFRGKPSQFQERAARAEEDSLPTGWNVDLYNYEIGNDSKGTGREVAYEDSKAMQRYEREERERAEKLAAYQARRRQRMIQGYKAWMEYVHEDPQPGQYTIVDRPEFHDPTGRQLNGNGYYRFNVDGDFVHKEPMAPFYVHKPQKEAVFDVPNRSERRAGITEVKPKYHHLLQEHTKLYSRHGNWVVDFELAQPPPKSQGELGWKHFESLPRPDRIDVRISSTADYDVTYTWSKSRIAKNKLQHALNGNISFFRCEKCDRDFAIKGMSKNARCAKCSNPAKFLHSKEKAKEPTSKGGRAGKKQDSINASVKNSDAQAAGSADALRDKEAEKLEITTKTPEGHIIDMPADDVRIDIPETDYQMPTTLYMQNTNRSRSLNWIIIFVMVALWVSGACLIGFEHYFSGTVPFLVSAVLVPGIRKTLPYLRFELERIFEAEKIPDMRPDYMGHSKMKHQGRRARYSVCATNSSHTQDTWSSGKLAAYRNLLDYLTGAQSFRTSIVVDVEIFSQISPSVKMIPEQFAIDRIDNSISRLATVNYDRHDSAPILDATLTLLKAYHWHHVQVKIACGYFSPYELTAPTRR